MAWTTGKQSHKAKNFAKNLKKKRKVTMDEAALGLSLKERPATSIEELRRQGLMLAGRGIGQYTRVKPAVPSPSVRSSNPTPESSRHVRRRTPSRKR